MPRFKLFDVYKRMAKKRNEDCVESDPTKLNVGQVVRLTSITHHANPPDNIQLSYRTVRDKVFVCALIGFEAKDGSERLDLEKAMNAIGWVRSPKAKKLKKR